MDRQHLHPKNMVPPERLWPFATHRGIQEGLFVVAIDITNQPLLDERQEIKLIYEIWYGMTAGLDTCLCMSGLLLTRPLRPVNFSPTEETWMKLA